MSMILEALRRADRERHKRESAPPNLTTTHRPPIARDRRRHRRLVQGILLLLIGAGLGLGLAQWQWGGAGAASPAPSTAPDPSRPPEPAPVSEAPPAPTSIGQAALTEQYPRPEQSDVKPAAEVAQLYRSEPERREPEIQRLYAPPQSDPSPSRVTPARAEPQPETEPPAEPEVAPEPEPRNLQKAPDALSIRALPDSVQRAIPSIYYQSHHYREGADSHVVLNHQEFRVGDEVVDEVILEQIAEDGIRLSFRDQQFRLARLSSWVNL